MCERSLTSSARLWQPSVFADVSIACRAYEFPIHRCILACQSTCFKDAFLAMERNNTEKTLQMHNEDPDTLRTVLRYFYAGEVNVPYDNLIVLRGPEMPSIDILRKVHVLAIKCDLPELKRMAARQYRNTLAEKWPKGYGILLANALLATFGDDLTEPEAWREATLDATVVHSDELVEDPGVYDMLKGEPLRALVIRLSRKARGNDKGKCAVVKSCDI